MSHEYFYQTRWRGEAPIPQRQGLQRPISRTIVKALAPMPDDTVIDGDVVASDPEGRPSFNLLQSSVKWQRGVFASWFV